jgi:PhnB protein
LWYISGIAPTISLEREKQAMSKSVKAIPDGFHTLTVYLAVPDAAKAIDFYKRALGAVERYRLPGAGGKGVGHAEITIGDSIVMLADESDMGMAKSPLKVDGNTAGLCLYVDNVDASFERAVKAGATVKRPVQDMFYGDRTGTVTDPWGYHWSLMTHVEDVAPDEMLKRMEAMFANIPQGQPV